MSSRISGYKRDAVQQGFTDLYRGACYMLYTYLIVNI
jgi:hypothetical protein